MHAHVGNLDAALRWSQKVLDLSRDHAHRGIEAEALRTLGEIKTRQEALRMAKARSS
jgi:hypothetical protein